MELFNYKWYIKSGYPSKGIKAHNSKVFGTFICGGGSSMGYKLAGFSHLGGVEIDKSIADVYQLNHKPKHLYNENIRDFVKRKDLPKELYELDVLDGSPPCSSFSMAGNREKDWGKAKKFKEGQKKQTLDDLFFEYIKLAKKLQPKICIAENVKGLISGNAKVYVKRIKKEFESANYDVQLFLLNAANMAVPQRRERVFFICRRKDLNLPKIKLQFNEKIIPFREISDENDKEKKITALYSKYYDQTTQGKKIGKYASIKREKDSVSAFTCTTRRNFHSRYKRELNDNELKLIGTFPQDYNFGKIDAQYLIGMSVPPVMMAQIANEVYKQFLAK